MEDVDDWPDLSFWSIGGRVDGRFCWMYFKININSSSSIMPSWVGSSWSKSSSTKMLDGLITYVEVHSNP